jgi:hypothetical protein
LEPRFLGIVRAKLRTEVMAVRRPPSLDIASAQGKGFVAERTAGGT